MLIKGFSEYTRYTCADCHLKCCATEFNLPLCGSEKFHLTQKYPEFMYYFQSTKEEDIILRGNSCPFLTKSGKCQLHTTSLKPLSCQIYPIIFWRFNEKDTLVSIHPCRGKGFQWYSTKGSFLSNTAIEQLLLKIKNYFNSYWGEEIDKNNPYESISPSRVEKQMKFYNNTSEDQLLAKMVKNINFTSYSDYFPSFHETTINIFKDEMIGKFFSSVLKWLIWSPVGLQLSIENAQLIFSIAALWLNEQTKTEFGNITSFLNDTIYIDQLSSFYASSLLPSFWLNIVYQTKSKALSSLASKIYSVLKGELPQEDLFQFHAY